MLPPCSGDPSGTVLACQSAGRSIELFRSGATYVVCESRLCKSFTHSISSASKSRQSFAGLLQLSFADHSSLTLSQRSNCAAAAWCAACARLSPAAACRLRSDADAKKHMRRRRKRKREKATKAAVEDGSQPLVEHDAAVTAADELEPLQVLWLLVTLLHRLDAANNGKWAGRIPDTCVTSHRDRSTPWSVGVRAG